MIWFFGKVFCRTRILTLSLQLSGWRTKMWKWGWEIWGGVGVGVGAVFSACCLCLPFGFWTTKQKGSGAPYVQGQFWASFGSNNLQLDEIQANPVSVNALLYHVGGLDLILLSRLLALLGLNPEKCWVGLGPTRHLNMFTSAIMEALHQFDDCVKHVVPLSLLPCQLAGLWSTWSVFVAKLSLKGKPGRKGNINKY